MFIPEDSTPPLLSLVVPMYNESDGLENLFARLTKTLDEITDDWEIICVDDGSQDDTHNHLKARHESEPRIKVISLSRNFGKEAALTAGLEHAYGQAVVPIDADLQDPPELIPQMVAKWKAGYKVVLATRRSRESDKHSKRLSASLYYKLLTHLSDTHIPENTGDFRLMDQQVVQVMRLLPERSRFMKGLFAWAGFKTTQIYFDREPRAQGEASQSISSLYTLAKNGIIAFSTLPLRAVTYLGLIISILAFSYAGFLLIRTLVIGVDVPGYASIMAAVLCIGGIQLVCIGIIGEYLGHVYNETKKRPIYIIEEETGLTNADHYK